MPTVLRWNGYEGAEPPHIHVDKAGSSAKYWLEPVALARNIGYSAKELKEIEAKISQERTAFVESWRVYFS